LTHRGKKRLGVNPSFFFVVYTCIHSPLYTCAHIRFIHVYSSAYTCIQSCIFMQNFSPKTGSPRSAKNFSMVEHKVESRKSKILKSRKSFRFLIKVGAKGVVLRYLRIIPLYRGSIYKNYTQKLFFSTFSTFV